MKEFIYMFMNDLNTFANTLGVIFSIGIWIIILLLMTKD